MSSPRLQTLLTKRMREQYQISIDFNRLLTSAYLIASYEKIGDDVELKTIYVNELCCRLTGYSRANLIGNDPWLLEGKFTDKGTIRLIQDRITRGAMIEDVPIIYYTVKDAPFLTIVSMYPLYNPETFEIEHYVIFYMQNMSPRSNPWIKEQSAPIHSSSSELDQ